MGKKLMIHNNEILKKKIHKSKKQIQMLKKNNFFKKNFFNS